MTDSKLYPNVREVKDTLKELRPSLGIIAHSAFMQTFDLTGGIEENKSELLFNHPKLKKLTEWFIDYANLYSEEPISELKSYLGKIDDRQLLTYLHCDPMPLRLTLTVADSDNFHNPSTLVCPGQKYLDFASKTESPSGFYHKIEELPRSIFEPQAPEGSVVAFVRNQYHSEANLPPNTAKLVLIANPS